MASETNATGSGEQKRVSPLNLPNSLSLLRMALVPFFVWAVLAMDPNPANIWGRLIPAAIFGLTALTDRLDGQIARKYNLITNFGKFLDPLADKFMVFSALLVMVYRYTYLSPVFLWATVIVMFRDLAVTALRLVAAGQSGKVIAASWPGKIKTVTQIVTILVVLLEPLLWQVYGQPVSPVSYVAIGAMTVAVLYSGADYLRTYLPVLDLAK